MTLQEQLDYAIARKVRDGNVGYWPGVSFWRSEQHRLEIELDKGLLRVQQLDEQTFTLLAKDGETYTITIVAEHEGCNDPGAFCVPCHWELIGPQLKLSIVRGRPG